MTSKSKQHSIKLKPSSYQPSKAELEENIKLNLKGKSDMEKMDNLAKVIFHPANAQ